MFFFINFLKKISLSQICATYTVLFAVIDIIGSIPVIVSIRNKAGFIQAEKASIISGFILISFLFFGIKILKLFGVDIHSFAIAGAIVIFILALEMILGIEINKDIEGKTASIVPIAFPLIAGTGSLTTVISLRSQYDDVNIFIAILLNIIVVFLVLKFSGKIEKIIGIQFLSIIKKVFGVVLLSISIKLFTSNIIMMIK